MLQCYFFTASKELFTALEYKKNRTDISICQIYYGSVLIPSINSNRTETRRTTLATMRKP